MIPTLATLDRIAGRPVLRFERRLAHAPEKVWKAITDPAELAHWFPARIETELKVGARMRFVFEEGPDIDAPDGEIVELDPPRVFVYRWGDDMLRWEIVPDGAGCRLFFAHTLSDAQGGELAAGRNAAGWDECLAALSARLDGRSRELSPNGMLEPMEAYIERFGLGEGELSDHPDGFLVRFERDLVWQPVGQVWATLTEPADAEETELTIGAAAPLRATNGYLPAGSITEIDPPHVLQYAWLHDGQPAGQVRWEISFDPKSGTRLVLTQTVPARLAELRATALAAWHTHLELFFAALFGVVRCPWPAERTDELKQRYAARIGAP